jgi:hypothetical protein
MAIPWFYIYSPKYEAFHKLLQCGVGDCAHFDFRPQFREQRFFEKPAHAADHFFAGNSLKFRFMIDAMKELPEESVFIISDADLLVLDPRKFFSICNMRDYDFIGMVDNLLDTSVINIGLLFCKNTHKLRIFFSDLCDAIEATGQQDQYLFNTLLKSTPLKYTTFDLNNVIQSNMVHEISSGDICVIQMLCSNKHYESNIFEKLMSACYFYNITPILDLVPYDVKEALVLFCRDHLPLNPVSRVTLMWEIVTD